MKKTNIKTGDKFGRLTVIKELETNPLNGQYRRFVFCKCNCGNTKTVRLDHLVYKYILSCGCYNKQRARERATIHGDSKTRLHNIWTDILRRCYDKKVYAYKWYGAKGVSVYKSWLIYKNFKTWCLSHGYKDNLTIDRINPSKHYEPKNCRWIPKKEQGKNLRKSIFYKGEHSLSASIRLGGGRNLVRHRIKVLGWNLKDAFTKPIKNI